MDDELVIRPLTRDDRALMADLPARISPAAASLRFHAPTNDLPEALLDRLLELRAGEHEAMIALDGGDIVGIARFARDPGCDVAEVAVVTADDWQQRGVGQRLVGALAARAREVGITAFRADMLTENAAARRFFAGVAPVLDERRQGDHWVMTLDLGSPGRTTTTG